MVRFGARGELLQLAAELGLGLLRAVGGKLNLQIETARLQVLPFQRRKVERLFRFAVLRLLGFAETAPHLHAMGVDVFWVFGVQALQLYPLFFGDEPYRRLDLRTMPKRGDGRGFGVGIFTGQASAEKFVDERRLAGLEAPDDGDLVVFRKHLRFQQLPQNIGCALALLADLRNRNVRAFEQRFLNLTQVMREGANVIPHLLRCFQLFSLVSTSDMTTRASEAYWAALQLLRNQ